MQLFRKKIIFLSVALLSFGLLSFGIINIQGKQQVKKNEKVERGVVYMNSEESKSMPDTLSAEELCNKCYSSLLDIVSYHNIKDIVTEKKSNKVSALNMKNSIQQDTQVILKPQLLAYSKTDTDTQVNGMTNKMSLLQYIVEENNGIKMYQNILNNWNSTTVSPDKISEVVITPATLLKTLMDNSVDYTLQGEEEKSGSTYYNVKISLDKNKFDSIMNVLQCEDCIQVNNSDSLKRQAINNMDDFSANCLIETSFLSSEMASVPLHRPCSKINSMEAIKTNL